mmetsp:Transcript_1115/g.3558  ORF Transcript_1115/g.3558 Transcript_1115/m.3558 type:complete len:269 (+) Transcript_1115:431-1237(+)
MYDTNIQVQPCTMRYSTHGERSSAIIDHTCSMMYRPRNIASAARKRRIAMNWRIGSDRDTGSAGRALCTNRIWNWSRRRLAAMEAKRKRSTRMYTRMSRKRKKKEPSINCHVKYAMMKTLAITSTARHSTRNNVGRVMLYPLDTSTSSDSSVAVAHPVTSSVPRYSPSDSTPVALISRQYVIRKPFAAACMTGASPIMRCNGFDRRSWHSQLSSHSAPTPAHMHMNTNDIDLKGISPDDRFSPPGLTRLYVMSSAVAAASLQFKYKNS